MKRFLVVFLSFLIISACSGKTSSIEENLNKVEKDVSAKDDKRLSDPNKPFVTSRNIYENEEVYRSVYKELNYFEFRIVMLNQCLEN